MGTKRRAARWGIISFLVAIAAVVVPRVLPWERPHRPARPADVNADHPLARGWRQVPIEPAEDAYTGAQSVRIEDGVLVAQGWNVSGCCDHAAQEWSSADGLVWHERPLPEPLDGSLMTGAEAWVEGGGVRVAVGTWSDGCTNEGCDRGAAAWLSTHGANWTRVPDDPLVFGEAVMRHAWWGPEGFTALGVQFDAEGREERPVLWVSADGRSWRRAGFAPLPFHWGLSTVRTRHAIIAVGGNRAWRSEDGRRWHQAAPFPAAKESESESWRLHVLGGDVLALRQRFVPIRSALRPLERPQHHKAATEVWRTSDGRTWERIGFPFGEPSKGRTEVRDITALPSGWLALGTYDGRSALWTSRDGRRWDRIPDVESALFEASEIIAFGDLIVAVGEIYRDDIDSNKPAYQGMAWVHPIP